MTQISRPWGGNLLGDCGRYDGQQWSERIRTVRLNSDLWNDRGPMAGSLNELLVEPTAPASMAVQVRTGSALVEKRWYHNTAIETLPITAHTTGVDRYDRIVLRKMWAAGTIRLAVLEGTPGSGIPALTQTVGIQYEIPLAYVRVASGAVTIVAADITDEREHVQERRKLFGMGDFETDPGWNTAVIDALPTGDCVAWKLSANDIIEMSWDIPGQWGDSLLVVAGWIWGLAAAAEGANIYADSYAHGAAAANPPLWGTLTQATGNIRETPIVVTNPLAVTPGEVLLLYIQESVGATDLFILGMELRFRRQ